MRNRKQPTTDSLPPHNPDAERGALSCLLQLDKAAPLLELAGQLRPLDFYDLRHRELLAAIKDVAARLGAFDLVLLAGALKKGKRTGRRQDAAGTDLLQLAQELQDVAPSAWQFPAYLEELREAANRRRLLDFARRVADHAEDATMDPRQLLAEAGALTAAAAGQDKAATLRVWRPSELLEHQPPTHLQLVGDNELVMGYEGVVVLAGPGSSGKSLAVDALALAGAIGKGEWMGRSVHRPFRTLIIQAENGMRRLKKIIEEFQRHHPKANIEDAIRISSPPEGGIPFHRPDFRDAVRREVEAFKPDLVVLDPWSQVATEDAAKEVVDKLGEIRSCFPTGDNCPGLLIVAHTKKPRPEDVRKGRGLTYLVSGSVALPNTARCVYVLLPWSDEMEDDRVYFACPKLNDGQMYAASVWHRKLGTFFERDTKTDAREWGKEEPDEARGITELDLEEAFETQSVLAKSALVKRLMKRCGCSEPTAYRAITPGPKGYLASRLEKTKEGWLQLKAHSA